MVEHTEGLDEGVEHRMRELEDELLGPTEGGGLGAREVGEPVHKVEGHVRLLHGLGLQHLLELGEEGRGRRLALGSKLVW